MSIARPRLRLCRTRSATEERELYDAVTAWVVSRYQRSASVTKAADEIQRLADELKDLLATQLAAIHDELQKKGQPQP